MVFHCIFLGKKEIIIKSKHYLDFRSYLQGYYQKSLAFALKVLLHSKFIAKSTEYRKTTAKKPKPIEIWPKRWHSSVLPGSTKCSLTSHTRWRQGGHHGDICKYRWTGRLCRSLTPRAGQALSARRDYKPREARRLWRLTSRAIRIWLIINVSASCSMTIANALAVFHAQEY